MSVPSSTTKRQSKKRDNNKVRPPDTTNVEEKLVKEKKKEGGGGDKVKKDEAGEKKIERKRNDDIENPPTSTSEEIPKEGTPPTLEKSGIKTSAEDQKTDITPENSAEDLKNKKSESEINTNSSVSSPSADVVLPRPLACGHYPSLRIDLPVKGAALDFKLDLREDIYQDVFYHKRHYNFIGKYNLKEHFVVSVLDEPTRIKDGFTVHRSLTTTKKGYEEFDLEVTDKEPNIPLLDRIETALSEREGGKEIYSVSNNAQFATEIVKLEETHPQRRKEMKIGVMYCRKGQVFPADMFQNGIGEDKLCDQFWTFINLMGKKIILENWEGYKGDMGGYGETYHDKWRDIDIIYHVSPMLTTEGHRRLIGNDILVILFLEEGEDTYFDPSHLDKLGTVPQVYGVVQPVQDRYRLAFFSNINIKSFGPEVPNELISPELSKNLILAKMHNGLLMTKFCPPINRLFFVPRGEFLESIIAKFPYESKKARKAREKEERKMLQEQRGEKLLLKTIAAKHLFIPKDKTAEYCSPYLTISLLDQKEKTKPIKGSACPVWNANFIFSLVGANEVYDDLEIVCLDHNHSDFMGEVKITLKEVREKAKNQNSAEWYFLQKRIPNDHVAGAIMLKFSLQEHIEEVKNEPKLTTEKVSSLKEKEKPLAGSKVALSKITTTQQNRDERTGRRLSM